MLMTSNNPSAWPTVILDGQQFAALNERQAVEHVMHSLAEGKGGWVVTANLDHLRRMRVERGYRRLCQSASMVVADGMPLVWASRLQGTPLPERVAGSNLVDSLSEAAAREGRSVYLLGGSEGTGERAAGVLQQRYPRLRVAGTCCPPFGFEHEAEWDEKLGRLVEQAKPDIVYVGLGSPKQEKLIERLRGRLPGAWWLGVGVSFSFVCGHVKRAPLWMQQAGLEWIHRMVQEPGRLARRYLIDDLPFGLWLMSSCLWRRWRGRPGNGQNTILQGEKRMK